MGREGGAAPPPLLPSRTLREEFIRSIADQRMMAAMVGLFGGIALLLAAYMAGQQTMEIGIGMALGGGKGSICEADRGLRTAADGMPNAE